MKKLGQKEITGTLRLLSGTRIGGSDELLQIGAVDLTCIKHPTTREPYLPGSSLKGKIRAELEKTGKFGWNGGNNPCGCAKCLVCRVFGAHGNKRADYELGPTRILVRDAFLLENSEFAYEVKTENVVGRKSGSSNNVFKGERVAPGAEFLLKIGIQFWDLDENLTHNSKRGADALVEFVKDGLRELKKTGIGSGTSKGYGEIEFVDLKLDGETFEL